MKIREDQSLKKTIMAVIFAAVLLLTGCGGGVGNVSPSPSAQPSPSEAPTPSAQPSPSAPAGVQEASAADYFPFKADVHMTYQGTGNEFAFYESWVDYVSNDAIQIRSNNGGTETVEVYTVDGGALKKVFSLGEAYYRYDFTTERETEEVMIMEPIAVGTAWNLAGGEKRSITAVDADVTVPYGTFKALEVTTEHEGSTTKDYYVRGLGLIKKEFTSKETDATVIASELEKYEEGSPFTQNIRFYFPDFYDGISYVDLKIDFKTGDGAVSVIEREFKDVASDSGLARVMKEGSAIRSIALDRMNKVVTVDFTKAFITEMNAGASYEGRILECVADTLGRYFQTDKVQIMIEGGPYESGHFRFDSGDYLPFNPDGAYARP